MVKVSWFAAQAYCESEHARLPAARVGVCRRCRCHAYAMPALSRMAQPHTFRVFADSGGTPRTLGGAANAYGVRDLHGLVWEWVDDSCLDGRADNREQGDPERLKFLRGRCAVDAGSRQLRHPHAHRMLSSLKGADVTGNLGFRLRGARSPEQAHESLQPIVLFVSACFGVALFAQAGAG